MPDANRGSWNETDLACPAGSTLMDVLARAGLKESEARIAALVCEGLTNRQIGRACGLTEGTVKVYLHRIYPKLSVNSKSGLAAKVTTLRISVEASSDTK